MIAKILVVEDKDGRAYFDASSPILLAKASMRILRERFEEGWYVEHDPEDFEAVRDTPRHREMLAENAWYARAFQLVQENDLDSKYEWGEGCRRKVEPMAWHLLKQRANYEYERVSLESVY